MQLTATFIVEKETKNTVRYQETDGDQPPIMGSAYVQKWALKKLGAGSVPGKITIVISAE